MSVFELESLTVSIVEHVKTYHSDFMINDKIIFSIVREAEFPPNAVVLTIDVPDPHHRCVDATDSDGKYIKNRHFKRHFREKRARLGDFSICEADGSIRPLSEDDIAEWARQRAEADAG